MKEGREAQTEKKPGRGGGVKSETIEVERRENDPNDWQACEW